MVIVDSSVWTTALKKEVESYKARIQLEELLRNNLVSMTDSARFDLLQIVKNDQRAELLDYTNQLPIVPVKPSTWNIAIQVSWDLAEHGINLSNAEAVTVALSLQTKSPLFTLSIAQQEVTRVRKITILV